MTMTHIECPPWRLVVFSFILAGLNPSLVLTNLPNLKHALRFLIISTPVAGWHLRYSTVHDGDGSGECQDIRGGVFEEFVAPMTSRRWRMLPITHTIFFTEWKMNGCLSSRCKCIS